MYRPIASPLPGASSPLPRVVVLDEGEYQYGTGALRMRVDRVTPLRSEPGWVLLGGVRIDHRGVEREPRDVAVSVRTLQRHGL